jgi:hypothetical protein
MVGRGGTVNSSQRACGELGTVELVEPESAVDEGGLARLGRSLPYTLNGTAKSPGIRLDALAL